MPLTLITGANRGIGLELVRQLAARGDDVLAVCRRSSNELASTGASVLDGVDVTDAGGVERVRARVGDTPLRLLVHNAGIFQTDALETLDLASVRLQLEVNAIAPLALTKALRPRLATGAKVALITSRMGSMGDNGSGGHYGYRMSKAALNAAGVSLAHDLRPAGIPVVLLHPGFVRTDMTQRSGNVDAHEAASMLLARLDALTLATSGKFWHANGEELGW